MERLIKGLSAAIVLLAVCACTTDPTPPGLIGGGTVRASKPLSEDARNSLAAETASMGDDGAPMMDEGDGGPAMAAVSPSVAGETARLQFTPVMGADASELAPLNRRLVQRGAERGIAVSMNDDPAAAYIVKGYFSTLSEAGGNTLVYVWDVFDRSGARVHRIQGQEAAHGQGAGAALRGIADRTMDDLAGWLQSRPG